MNLFLKSFKNNLVVIFWFFIFVLFLLFKTTGNGESNERLISGVWEYLAGSEFIILLSALLSTLSVAFPVTIAILAIALVFACLSYFKPKTSPIAVVFMCLSLLPTVYFIFLVRLMIGSFPDSKLFVVFVLTFSNLILFFFYLGFQKELHEELSREYHLLSRQLGVKSKIQSSLKKIALILMERFPPLFILVFSSTIFAEQKLSVSRGIYYLFYRTTTSFSGRPDIFYGQLAFILLFVVLFLVSYDTMSNYIKERFY